MIQHTFLKIYMVKYFLQFRSLLIYKPSNQNNIFFSIFPASVRVTGSIFGRITQFVSGNLQARG